MSRIFDALRRFRAASRELELAQLELVAAMEAAVEPHAPEAPAEIRIIQRVVAERYRLDPALLTGCSREAEICTVRHIAARLCRELTAYRKETVALAFNRDRGAIENSVRVISDRLNTEDRFPAELAAVRAAAQAALAEHKAEGGAK